MLAWISLQSGFGKLYRNEASLIFIMGTRISSFIQVDLIIVMFYRVIVIAIACTSYIEVHIGIVQATFVSAVFYFSTPEFRILPNLYRLFDNQQLCKKYTENFAA